jgi:hypothetical protein
MVGNLEYKRIGFAELDDCTVSTVWLGIDYGFGPTPQPLIFETMVFPSGSFDDVYCQRYGTEADARAGHDAITERVRAVGVAAFTMDDES